MIGCNEFQKLMEELQKGVEVLEKEGVYTGALILIFKMLVAKIDYELCLKGKIVKDHRDRRKVLEEFLYDEKFRNLKECYEKLYHRYRGAYRKIVSKEEYESYKKLLEKCLD